MLEGGITDDDDDDDNAVERNNNPNNNASLYDIDGNYIGTLNDFEVTGLVQNAKDEATRRSTLEETYLTPLEDEHCLLSNDSAHTQRAWCHPRSAAVLQRALESQAPRRHQPFAQRP